MIYVIAWLEAEAEDAERIKAAAAPLIAATRQEDGCIAYDLNEDVGAPGHLVFVEKWESREHLEAHFRTAHIAAFGAAIESVVKHQRLEIIDPKHVEAS
jgi:quinol monooxygenase YgiN